MEIYIYQNLNSNLPLWYNYNRTHSHVYFYSEIESNNDVVKVTNHKDYQQTHSNTNGVNSH